jgi:hypothetical protein
VKEKGRKREDGRIEVERLNKRQSSKLKAKRVLEEYRSVNRGRGKNKFQEGRRWFLD